MSDTKLYAHITDCVQIGVDLWENRTVTKTIDSKTTIGELLQWKQSIYSHAGEAKDLNGIMFSKES